MQKAARERDITRIQLDKLRVFLDIYIYINFLALYYDGFNVQA
jgi:hypothetical protein